MRRVTLYLFIAVSLFSLALGFYDLYKNVPFLRTMLHKMLGNMYLPIVQWLEEHTKVGTWVDNSFPISCSAATRFAIIPAVPVNGGSSPRSVSHACPPQSAHADSTKKRPPVLI